MREEYEVIRTPTGEAWIKSAQVEQLQKVDAIAFDCDGVLVDARQSYNATIPKVVDQLLNATFQVRLPWKQFAPRMITMLRRTGKFNNDWDTTYALTLFSMLSLPTRVVQDLILNPRSGTRPGYSKLAVMTKIFSTVKNFCSKLLNEDAPIAVNRFVNRNVQSIIHKQLLVSLQEKLGYPGSPPHGLLSTLFDEVYHGPVLFRRIYGVAAQHYQKRGLIENERILVRERDLYDVNKLLGRRRLAIITGRPYLATEYVLHDMLNYFNVQASLFIGDIDVHPELAGRLAPFRKPSGRGLGYVRRALLSRMLLYVGDSAEDIEMVENARRDKEPALSAGIYGTNSDPSEHLRFFFKRRTDLILPTARSVPEVLRFVKYEKCEN
jgi:phosphoglycolate phosphatase-like HAD superfamily hydrolase